MNSLVDNWAITGIPVTKGRDKLVLHPFTLAVDSPIAAL